MGVLDDMDVLDEVGVVDDMDVLNEVGVVGVLDVVDVVGVLDVVGVADVVDVQYYFSSNVVRSDWLHHLQYENINILVLRNEG